MQIVVPALQLKERTSVSGGGSRHGHNPILEVDGGYGTDVNYGTSRQYLLNGSADEVEPEARPVAIEHLELLVVYVDPVGETAVICRSVASTESVCVAPVQTQVLIQRHVRTKVALHFVIKRLGECLLTLSSRTRCSGKAKLRRDVRGVGGDGCLCVNGVGRRLIGNHRSVRTGHGPANFSREGNRDLVIITCKIAVFKWRNHFLKVKSLFVDISYVRDLVHVTGLV